MRLNNIIVDISNKIKHDGAPIIICEETKMQLKTIKQLIIFIYTSEAIAILKSVEHTICNNEV